MRFRFFFAFSAMALLFSSVFTPEVSAADFFISPSGNDSNAGTVSAPFLTLAKASSVLNPGDTLFLMAGTYRDSLRLSRSGNSSSPIIVKPHNTDKVVLPSLVVSGSYYQISNLEVANCVHTCIDVSGNYNIFDTMDIHHAQDMGIQFSGDRGVVRNSTVYLNAYSNKPKTLSHGWASGVKVRAGTNVLIENNRIYNNYGEGIATRGRGGIIRNNTVYDNYSINIYADEANDYVIEKNFTYCTTDQEFYRNGSPAVGIGIAEEYYADFNAAILGDVTIRNNVVANCNSGLYYSEPEAEIEGTGGLDHILILNNTFWGSKNTALYIEDETFKTRNSVIANNIIHQAQGKLANIKPTTGITMRNNLWVTPPSITVLVNAAGTGDIRTEPKMVSVPGGVPEISDFMLQSDSPAIDAGATFAEVTDDYLGNQRLTTDIGAFEYGGSSPASPTPTPLSTPTPTPSVLPCNPADINRDGTINILDYTLLSQNFLSAHSQLAQADINGDGVVNLLDYSILISNLFENSGC